MYALRLEDALDQQIYDEGIALERHFFNHSSTDGLYFNTDDLTCPVITINKNITSTQETNYIKAHELGHHHSCIRNLFDAPAWIQKRYEMLADRDWVERIMSLDRLVEAYDHGNNTPMSLADYLEIPLEALVKGIDICYRKYGLVTYFGQHCIYWNPFNIKKDRRRGAKCGG